MRKQIEITIPDSWKDITLKKYIELNQDLESYKDDEEAQAAFLLYHMCNIDLEKLNNINKADFDLINNELIQFMNNVNLPLQKIITINGVEYGFEPNLSKMAYGAYVDITKYKELALNKDWASIMSILYRPVDKKLFDTYSIKPYEGVIDSEKWLNVSMDIHLGAYFFFVRTLMDLSNSIRKSLTEVMEKAVESLQTLVKSGELTQQ